MLRFVSRSYLDSDDGARLVDAGSWVLRRLTSGLMFCDLAECWSTIGGVCRSGDLKILA